LKANFRKKRIAPVLAIFMALSLLAACSGGGNTATSSAVSPKTAPSAAGADDGQAIAPFTDPLANPIGSTQIVKTPGSVTISIGLIQDPNVSSYTDNYLTKWIYENAGVNLKFELYPAADAIQKMDLQVSSGDKLPDIVSIGMTDKARAFNYGSNGAIIPLDDLFDRLGETWRKRAEKLGLDFDMILAQTASADGHNYGVPFRDANLNNLLPQRGFINKTWLDKLGLQIPTNSEELVTVLTAFRDQDPNGNGVKDEIPMMGAMYIWGAHPLGYLQNMFIYYNDSVDHKYYLPLSQTGGKVDVSYDKPEYREALKYSNKLVSEGLLTELSFTTDNPSYSKLKRADPAVLGLVITGAAVDLYFGNSPDKYVPYEVMKGPNGVQWQTRTLNAPVTRCAISADCEHPEIAFMLASYTTINDETVEYNFLSRFGEKDVDWRYALPSEKSMFELEGIPAKVKQLQSTWGTMTNKHFQGKENFGQLVDPLDRIYVFDGDESNDEYQYALNYSYNLPHAPAYEDLIPPLTYTMEEAEKWTDPMLALKTYVDEAMSLFATGQLDPNSDADWNNYLNELNKLQYKEIMQVDQVAYDRMIARLGK